MPLANTGCVCQTTKLTCDLVSIRWRQYRDQFLRKNSFHHLDRRAKIGIGRNDQCPVEPILMSFMYQADSNIHIALLLLTLGIHHTAVFTGSLLFLEMAHNRFHPVLLESCDIRTVSTQRLRAPRCICREIEDIGQRLRRWNERFSKPSKIHPLQILQSEIIACAIPAEIMNGMIKIESIDIALNTHNKPQTKKPRRAG